MFHLGSFTGAHAQVLFRSGRSGYFKGAYLKYDSVVDILFKDVGALALTESYYRLEVSLADESETDEFCRYLRCEAGDRSLYVLRGEDSLGYVLAGALYWVDDESGSTEKLSVLLDDSERSKSIEVMRA
jgi:hypothetical protein